MDEIPEIMHLRMESALDKQRVADLERDVGMLKNLLQGAERQVIKTPSGIDGFNKQWTIAAVPLGDELVEGVNLDMFYATMFASAGQPPEITTGYVVCSRNGAVNTVLDARVVNDTTLGIGTSNPLWPKVGNIESVECVIGTHSSYTGSNGEKIYVACAVAKVEQS